MEPTTQDTPTTEAVCYRHPGRETRVSCSSCGRPICPDCMVDTPVGFKCPECARQPRSAIVRLRPDRAARAIGAAFAGGLAMGFGIVVLQGVGLFFALILGWLIGIAMSELVLWASGRWRGRETGWLAVAGCVWTYVVPYGLFYGVDLGDVARSGSLAFVFLGAVIACYVAYNRTR